jgi:glycyl-tRNA synthetase alpha subunit
MKQITLNPDQQRALALLEKKCKKVELYINNDDQKEAMCLLEDQKVIEVTFYDEDKLCVAYTDFEDNDECQETMSNSELNNSFINRMFKRVTNETDHLDHYSNQTHAQKIRDFLK